jgi:serralysin
MRLPLALSRAEGTMAVTFLTTNTINAGAGFTYAASGDEAHVMPGVLVGSTGGDAGMTSAAPVSATILGSVFGERALYLNTGAAAGTTYVYIGAEASVLGQNNLDAVSLNGAVNLVNHGEIRSAGTAGYGVYSASTTLTAVIVNYGSISAGRGVATNFASNLTNYGDILATSSSYFGGSGSDSVVNAGTMTGAIALGAGTDTYNGERGLVIGQVDGGAGNDTLTGGAFADSLLGGNDDDILRGNGGIDTLDGGNGNDTIYFSIEDATMTGGSGALDRAINTYNDFGLTFDMGGNSFEFYTGSAAGETIITSTATAIDVSAGGGNDLVQGAGGFDTLRGDDGNDTLDGFGGTDSLVGGNGDDLLHGGLGDLAIDNLTGGDGADRFFIQGATGGNDTITDFTIGIDRIQILRSGFLSPAVWSAGALDPARFQASANPSPINGTAMFLLDNAGPGAGQLYWNDGNGAATGIALITVAPGQTLSFFTAADFVLV